MTIPNYLLTVRQAIKDLRAARVESNWLEDDEIRADLAAMAELERIKQ